MSWRAQISRSIQELRFVACETSQSSQGLRCVPHEQCIFVCDALSLYLFLDERAREQCKWG